MTKWEPFLDQKKEKFTFRSDILKRLNSHLAMLNHGRRKDKLRLSDMISHWLLEMGRKPPKVEKSTYKNEEVEVGLYGHSSAYLEEASTKNSVSKEEIIEHLLTVYEAKEKISSSKKK